MILTPAHHTGHRETVSGWEACRAALVNRDLRSSFSGAGFAHANNILTLDGKDHRAVRQVVVRHLSRISMQPLVKRLQEVAGNATAKMLAAADGDLLTDLIEPIVLEGVFFAMGIAERHRDALTHHARGMVGIVERDQSEAELKRATNAALRATLIFERDGVRGEAAGLHKALEIAASGGALPMKLARTTPVVVLHGGYENPLNQLGCMAAWFSTRSARGQGSRPDLVFEEVLRAFSPVRRVLRYRASDNAGDRAVWIDLESANRDPTRYPDPFVVDPERALENLGFGLGVHMCPGRALSHIESAVLLEAMAALPEELLRSIEVNWSEGEVARGPKCLKWRT